MNFKTPVQLAKGACLVAKAKAAWSVPQMMILGVLAGAYIGFGGWLMTVVTHDMLPNVGLGLTRFMSGAVFCVGLMLVVISGAELFTGNCLMPMGMLQGCISAGAMFRNWFWVYVANIVGATMLAWLVYMTGIWNGPIGAYALKVGAGKMSLSFSDAFFRGILCNWLVVLAVWMAMAAQDIVGKIWAIFFPIMAFVASGFEHSIANGYFMPLAMLIKENPDVVKLAELPEAKLAAVSVAGYFNNLVPVTLGNIVGGVFFVAILYYFVFKGNLENLDG